MTLWAFAALVAALVVVEIVGPASSLPRIILVIALTVSALAAGVATMYLMINRKPESEA